MEENWNQIVPELTVIDFEQSLDFYTRILGFEICYQRNNPSFAYLELDSARLMLEELHDDGWLVAELTPPLGRGINLQITVREIDKLWNSIQQGEASIFKPLKEVIYTTAAGDIMQQEFLIQDPDGYLLRFCSRSI